jgi:hypothetical protein
MDARGDWIRRIRRLGVPALVLGAVGAAAGLLLGGTTVFFQAYLFAYLFWSSLTFGALAIILLQYLVGSEWGMVIQRPLEAGAKTIWLAALLFLPVLAGAGLIYPWLNPETVAANPVIEHKTPYLNLPFFALRAALYFLIWAGLARVAMGWARQERYWTDPDRRRNLQRFSALGLILFTLTMTLAAVDWIMSLHPDWYSTIFGFLVISGQALAGMALAIALLPGLVPGSALEGFITPRHIRDLGALLLTLVLFYAYIAFSQYIIIWSGNLPHEVTWYLARTGFWLALFLVVVAIQFVLPFFVLLSLRAKRNLRLVAGLALGILAMRAVDTYWLVTPAFYPGTFPGLWNLLLSLALFIGLGGLWLLAFAYHLQRTPQQLPLHAGEHPAREHGRQEPAI